MQQTEIEFLRDNAKRMPEIDDVMYFAIDEKAHSIDLTEKGREFLTSGNEDKDFFVLPDMGTEIAHLENDDTMSEADKIAKKDALGELYSLRSDRIHTVQQLLRAYSLYENDVEYVIQDNKIMIVDESIVIVGSYNFTNSAETRNDENLLVIYNDEIAAKFMDEFRRIYGLAK